MKIPNSGAWTFQSKEVAQAFDAHVREQLPWYDIATDAVADIARHYIPKGGFVYDIGASTGNIGRSIAPILEERGCQFVPIEASKEMAEQYNGPGDLLVADALEVDFAPFDFGVAFLCLIFMPPNVRVKFLTRIIQSLRPGGAIAIVERMKQGNGYPATIAARMTLSNKLKSGATPQDILAKELSLCGVQRPLDVSELPQNAVEFFRLGDFAGYIIEAR